MIAIHFFCLPIIFIIFFFCFFQYAFCANLLFIFWILIYVRVRTKQRSTSSGISTNLSLFCTVSFAIFLNIQGSLLMNEPWYFSKTVFIALVTSKSRGEGIVNFPLDRKEIHSLFVAIYLKVVSSMKVLYKRRLWNGPNTHELQYKIISVPLHRYVEIVKKKIKSVTIE